MRKHRGVWLAIPLFVLFAVAIVQFALSSLRIQALMKPLRPETAGQTEQLHRVVLVAQELDNPYWRSIGDSAIAAGSEQGLQVDYVGPLRINPDEQLTLLERAIASKADAILVQGTGMARSVSLLKQAKEAGIPVLTLDADEPNGDRAAYIGTDNAKAGQQMGRWVAERSGDRAVIGVIIGTRASDSQKQRLEGLRSVVATHPGMRILEVLTSDISRLKAGNETRLLLTEHPDVTDIVGLSSLDALGAMDAAEQLGRTDLRLYAFDDLPETQAAIAAGKLQLTLVQQPDEIGRVAIEQVSRLLQGDSVKGTSFTPVEVLTKEDLSAGKGALAP
ncbi:substrate-binding domain-containing protein [Gorillibacterium sp. CAU 1737]|uniref:substrate-binding domain-containing protein n=1 Tax=Gorillibacterium sp. CAU 1737 TaxID=3140362 RepID=UPI003260D5E3